LNVATLKKEPVIIGVISDTHNLLRPEVSTAFNGVDYIIHAGDIGSRDVLNSLETIAPTIAVAGNTDSPMVFSDLDNTAILEINKINILAIHNIDHLDLDPKTAGIEIVVYGHSHKPSIEYKKEVLFFNPGSAGPVRFDLPVSVGILKITRGKIVPDLVYIGS